LKVEPWIERRLGLKFVEIDLLGVYVAPISLLMIAAWIVTAGLRRAAARFGLFRYVWHPALFVFDIYIVVLSSMVLLIAR
jgi:protein AaeX